MVLPTTLSLVNANFQGKERVSLCRLGATIGGMVAVGLLAAGSQPTSRGAGVLINLPLGILISPALST